MAGSNHPNLPQLLYQVNTRVLLGERGRELGRPATLDDLPDDFLDDVAERGFAWIWFLGLWQTGEAGRAVSRTHPGIRGECLRSLPDAAEADIEGSPFAIRAYRTHADFGGDAALARLRGRMARRRLRLIADFVVNHAAPDHHWLREHAAWFITGTELDLAAAPGNWMRAPMGRYGSETVIAHGRDPYFPGWADTVQFNLRHPACREALRAELLDLAEKCDGARCDMAMLAHGDVIEKTWGDLALPRDGALPAGDPFWPESIRRVKARHPEFLFIAEAYWNREERLQDEGFDFTYDKTLYDLLRRGDAASARDRLGAPPAFQAKCLRFLENHDEDRAAAAFPVAMHRAAALVTYLSPGLRLFHEGQWDGRRAKVSMHLGRRPDEPPNPEWRSFYGSLLAALRRPGLSDGLWSLAPVTPAWEGNPTDLRFIAFAWNLPVPPDRTGPAAPPGILGVVNYGPNRGQCHVRVDLGGHAERTVRLEDLLSDARHVRKAADLARPGMYFDMPAWGFHLFEIL